MFAENRVVGGRGGGGSGNPNTPEDPEFEGVGGGGLTPRRAPGGCIGGTVG